MSITPVEQARAYLTTLRARAAVRMEESESYLAKAEAWAAFTRGLTELEKTGCLRTVTVTITDTEQEVETDSKDPEPTATVKVGDVLQEVIADKLPIGTQFEDRDGDTSAVVSDGIALSYRYREHEIRVGAPYTITYVPPTVPEPVVLDRLPDDMAEGSVVLSGEKGALIAFRDGGKTYWRGALGWVISGKTKCGTLTLLHDAGAEK